MTDATELQRELNYLRQVEQAARTFCGGEYHKGSLAALKRVLDQRSPESQITQLEAYEKALIRIRDEQIALTKGEPTADDWQPMPGSSASALAAEVLAAYLPR